GRCESAARRQLGRGVERRMRDREIGDAAESLYQIVALVVDVEGVAQVLGRLARRLTLVDDLPAPDDLFFHGTRLRRARPARQDHSRLARVRCVPTADMLGRTVRCPLSARTRLLPRVVVVFADLVVMIFWEIGRDETT